MPAGLIINVGLFAKFRRSRESFVAAIHATMFTLMRNEVEAARTVPPRALPSTGPGYDQLTIVTGSTPNRSILYWR